MGIYEMGRGRFVPSLPGWPEEARRMFYSNYKWASNYTKDKIVLDCACGSGYGTDFIAGNCSSVVGGDVDARIVKYAKDNYPSEKIRWACFSITSIPCPDSYFDVVVSFDTIEHVKDDYKVLPELKRVTKEDGYIILSTPLNNFRKEQGEEGVDPTHIREYSAYEWLSMLSTHFSEAEFFARDENFEFHRVYPEKYDGSPFDVSFVKLLNSDKSDVNAIEEFKHIHCLQLCDKIKSLELTSRQLAEQCKTQAGERVPHKAHPGKYLLGRARKMTAFRMVIRKLRNVCVHHTS